MHPPSYGFFLWNICDSVDPRIERFGEVPVDFITGMVAVGHRVERDYLAQFIREELE